MPTLFPIPFHSIRPFQAEWCACSARPALNYSQPVRRVVAAVTPQASEDTQTTRQHTRHARLREHGHTRDEANSHHRTQRVGDILLSRTCTWKRLPPPLCAIATMTARPRFLVACIALMMCMAAMPHVFAFESAPAAGVVEHTATSPSSTPKHALLVAIPLPVRRRQTKSTRVCRSLQAGQRLNFFSCCLFPSTAVFLQGHVNPLLSQGFELLRRGWHVTVASPNRMRQHILSAFDKVRHAESEDTSLAYLDLGDCAAVANLTGALRRSADHENYMESQQTGTDSSVGEHRPVRPHHSRTLLVSLVRTSLSPSLQARMRCSVGLCRCTSACSPVCAIRCHL